MANNKHLVMQGIKSTHLTSAISSANYTLKSNYTKSV